LLTGSLIACSALFNRRAAAEDRSQSLQDGIADLERRHGGRLGVAVLDTVTTQLTAHRGDERFPLCSTYKYLAVAFVLARVDRNVESLNRRIVYGRDDLVPYSPITEHHTGEGGLSVREICEAAMTVSDNTAGNLLLDSFGGSAELTSYLRSLGDGITRVDRRETALNEAEAGDRRDTTTPVAMLQTLQKTILGTALSVPSRQRLTAWLVACKTGDRRLKAGVPKGWRVGDKTGSGLHNATNDIAVIWPNGRAPVIVTTYYIESEASNDERNAILADVGRLVTT
jgi:beta-lactamase class A